jgi:hypothetical protein
MKNLTAGGRTAKRCWKLFKEPLVWRITVKFALKFNWSIVK